MVQLGGTSTNTVQEIGKLAGLAGAGLTLMSKSPLALVVLLAMVVAPLSHDSLTLAPERRGKKGEGEGVEQVRPRPMIWSWQLETEAVAMKMKAMKSAEVISFAIARDIKG